MYSSVQFSSDNKVIQEVRVKRQETIYCDDSSISVCGLKNRINIYT